MAEISFGGLATGLPTEDIVSSLMAVERRPLDRLEAEKEYEALRLKAYSQFDGKLDELREAAGSLNLTSEVRTTSVSFSSQGAVSASSSGAAEGSYDIAVAQLAQMQKSVTDGFSSQDASVLGTGTFTVGDTTINVGNDNNSLQGLAASINEVSGDTGVRASIINDGNDSNNYHLVLTGDDAATSFSVSHDLVDGAGDPITFATNQVRSAQQAIAYIDSIEVKSNTNTLTGVISGVTMNLNEPSEVITPATETDPAEYATTTMKVEADTDALKEKISTFVSSYNGVMDWITAGYDEFGAAAAAQESEDGEAEQNYSEMLRGDATINGVKRQLQSILIDSVGSSGSLQILSEIGISTRMDGTLKLDEGKLSTALETKFDDTVKLLAGEEAVDGVMKKFNAYLFNETSGVDGMYAEKRDRYDRAIRRLDTQIAQKEVAVAKTEERIRAQFNAMEQLVSSLNAQSDFLTQQMDMLSNLSTGNNS